MINAKKKTIIRPRKNKPMNKNMKNITDKKAKTKKNLISRNSTSRNTTSRNKQNQRHSQNGGGLINKEYASVDKRDNFQVTTLRSINQDDLNRFKISNYVNNNVDWGILPGAPPVDCCIM